jgi:hypothetical protein
MGLAKGSDLEIPSVEMLFFFFVALMLRVGCIVCMLQKGIVGRSNLSNAKLPYLQVDISKMVRANHSIIASHCQSSLAIVTHPEPSEASG